MASSASGNDFDSLFPPLRLSSSTSALKLGFPGMRRFELLADASLHCITVPILVHDSSPVIPRAYGTKSSVVFNSSGCMKLLDILESATVINKDDRIEFQDADTPTVIVVVFFDLFFEIRVSWAYGTKSSVVCNSSGRMKLLDILESATVINNDRKQGEEVEEIEDSSKGVHTLEVQVSKAVDSQTSDVFQISDKFFQLVVNNRVGVSPSSHLSIFLEMVDEDNPNVSVFVSFSVSTRKRKLPMKKSVKKNKSRKGDSSNVCKCSHGRFSNSLKALGWGDFIDKSIVYDLSSGILVDNKLELTVDVAMLNEDFIDVLKKDEMTSPCFLSDGRKFWIAICIQNGNFGLELKCDDPVEHIMANRPKPVFALGMLRVKNDCVKIFGNKSILDSEEAPYWAMKASMLEVDAGFVIDGTAMIFCCIQVEHPAEVLESQDGCELPPPDLVALVPEESKENPADSDAEDADANDDNDVDDTKDDDNDVDDTNDADEAAHQHTPSISSSGVPFPSVDNQDLLHLHGSDMLQLSHSSYHSQTGGPPGIGLRPLNSPNTVSGMVSYDQQHQNQSQFWMQQMSGLNQSYTDQGVKSMQSAQAAPDSFDLLGLISRTSDPYLRSLALGIDLTTLGLNLNSSDEPAMGNPEFIVPQCYHANQPPALSESYFLKFSMDALFYVFFSMPKDEAQLYAANELYNRGWFYHRELRLWLTRVDNKEPLVKTDTDEGGSYICFDPSTWETTRKDNLLVQYDILEERPTLPQH
ncbi:hypothetical protein RHGRI_003303 [Rhododendron griersonianum]|uniref:MATH domain-containing protein n=1 Tax=Rhododendron griersonianum TaxID=479676 RepID=A0AAV6L743_9ERIC|nr:hypothetical protein RHGRI_003303 [Rhododendron griersonianum]